MVFEGIGDLNVITGITILPTPNDVITILPTPNGVGKSRLLKEIYGNLKEDKWGDRNVFPVYFTYSNLEVKSDYKDDKKDYDKKLEEKVKEHTEFKKNCNLLNDQYKTEDVIKKRFEDDKFKKHKKKWDRYKSVYKEKQEEQEDRQVELQMKYELGMSSKDMFDEISTLKYLWEHRLIKFGENDDDTYKDSIDINSISRKMTLNTL